MYFLDIIERGPVLLFLWNKFAGRLHYKGKKNAKWILCCITNNQNAHFGSKHDRAPTRTVT